MELAAMEQLCEKTVLLATISEVINLWENRLSRSAE